MDIRIYHEDGSGSISYFNVCSIEFDEGAIYIDCICTDSAGCTYIEHYCWFISNVEKIEVLKVYDYRFV